MNNSRSSPCWQQQEIAAQNSYIESVTSKKETVFKAPCDVEKKVAKKG